jgi:hypothetical protein
MHINYNSNTLVACIRSILHPTRGQAVIVRIISLNIAFLCFMSPSTTRCMVTSGEASWPLRLLPPGNSKYFSAGARACVSLLGRMGTFCSWQDVETCAQINLNLSSPKKDVDLPCRPCRKHDAVGQCRIPHWATCPKWSLSSKVWNRSFSKRLRDLMQAVAPLMDNFGKKCFCVSRYPNTFLEVQIHFFDSRGG